MRIAICMRGAVGKFCGENAKSQIKAQIFRSPNELYKEGEYIDYVK